MGLSKHYDSFYKHPFESITPVVGTAEEISTFKSDGIDCIDSADTNEHITDVYITTDEMLRVLQPGRSLVNAIGYGMLGRIQSFHAPLLSSGVQLLAKKPIK